MGDGSPSLGTSLAHEVRVGGDFDVGAGSDFLAGGEGDDLFLGGLAFDALTGSNAADPLALQRLDVADLIADYGSSGGNRDLLELTALFEGPTPPTSGDLVNDDGEVVNGGASGTGSLVVAALAGAAATSTITILFDDGANDATASTSFV